MSRIKKGTDPQIKILQVLSKSKEFEQYRLPKETGFSYRTIFYEIQKLEDSKEIKFVKSETSAKRGKKKRVYAITKEGLFRVLLHGITQDELKTIAKCHYDKLRIFKKFSIFESVGLSEKLHENLTNLLHNLRSLIVIDPRLFSKKGEECDDIDQAILEQTLFFAINQRSVQLKNALKADEELKTYVTTYLCEEQENAQKQLDDLREISNFWSKE